MKKIMMMAWACITLCSCSQQDIRIGIRPLTPTFQQENLANGTYAAAFTTKDFDWRSQQLRMTLFSEDIYEGKQIDAMQPGDTLYFNADTVLFKTKTEDKNYVEINGGIEQGGANLVKTHEGDYRAVLMDDHSAYTKLGSLKLKFADDFTLIDCGDNPEDPYDTIRTSHKQYLDGVKEYKREFMELNTTITVKDGCISRITRRWIP